MLPHRRHAAPLVVALLVLAASAPAPVAAAPGETFADGFAELALAALPACPAEAERCFGIRLHVAERDDGVPAVTAAWLADQVAHADLVFADVGVGFEVVAVVPAGAAVARVLTRRDRDRLGRASHDRGLVDVWVVAQLANVDDPGDIRGVHWRDRARRADRWIILSAIAPTHVLAHELGHYFGVPHTDAPGSLMNKSGDDPTPSLERRFVATEQRTIKASARRFAAAAAPSDRRAPRRAKRVDQR